jgi:chemotaxis protein CheZ
MPVPQKIFRIETLGTRTHARATAGATVPATASNGEVLAEIRALRELIEQRNALPAQAALMTAADLSHLKDETDAIHRAISRTIRELASLHFGTFDGAEGRARRELDAVADGTEQATQQILSAAEGIDDAANTLSASLKSQQEQALASDIREHVVRIFEACNFQDLSGQRISKVIRTLTFVEDRVVRMMEIWGGRDAVKHYAGATLQEREPKLINGPKLDGDPGHASQQEIDAMFS